MPLGGGGVGLHHYWFGIWSTRIHSNHNGLTPLDDPRSADRNPSVLSTLIQWLGRPNFGCTQEYAYSHFCQPNASNIQACPSTSWKTTY